MTNMTTPLMLLPLRQKILGGLIILLVGVQISQTTLTFSKIWPLKRPTAFIFAGQKFASLAPLLKGQKYAGYYTDTNVDEGRALLELLQAQHILAPLILDPENLDHRYVIINCVNLPRTIEKFKAMGARPVAATPSGILLVERPEFGP